MGHLTWGDIAAILGSLASVFGGVRWLLAVYFKQQVKLDVARKDAFSSKIELLSNRISDLETKLSDTKYELHKFTESINSMMSVYNGTMESAEKVFKTLKDFIKETQDRIKKLETIQDPKAYNKVQVEEQPKPKVGKVIVKG